MSDYEDRMREFDKKMKPQRMAFKVGFCMGIVVGILISMFVGAVCACISV